MKKKTSIYNHIYNKVYIYNKVKRMAAKAVLFTFLCICLILSSSLLTSCDADNSISTKYPCQFISEVINTIRAASLRLLSKEPALHDD